jgi:hypothetical protein
MAVLERPNGLALPLGIGAERGDVEARLALGLPPTLSRTFSTMTPAQWWRCLSQSMLSTAV